MLRHLIIVFISCFCVNSELLNLEIGSKCTWNEIPGQCVNIYNCLSSYIDYKTKDFAPICTFQGKEPIICCTDCKLNDTRNLIINPILGILHKTGRKAEDKCTEYVHRLDYPCKFTERADMIRHHNAEKNCNEVTFNYNSVAASYGGIDAIREEFPHMALLGYGFDSKTADWLCGGSVISERFILTAGHCLSSVNVGEVKYIALGILKRTDPSELWQKYIVKRRIPHPEYKPPSKYHDIALLETDTEIVFSRQVLPACLKSTGEAEAILFATGWGALGHRRQLADTLQSPSMGPYYSKEYGVTQKWASEGLIQTEVVSPHVKYWHLVSENELNMLVKILGSSSIVSRFEEDECSKMYPLHRHLKDGYNHTTQMCYGDKQEPKDTCEGDSGGPLQDMSRCAYVIAGVTSYGRQCGIAAGSGIYTRVIFYVPWIESIVWP